MKSPSNKKVHRFNIVDLLIIAGIAVAVILGFYLLTGLVEDNIYTVNYCVKVDGVNEDVYNVLKKGERLYTDGQNIPVGVIEDVRYEKMKYSVFNDLTDRFEMAEHETLYTVYIDVVAGCVLENGAYKTETAVISANTKIDINLPFVFEDAEIIHISAKKHE